jgi:hypothetical protein
LTCNAPQLENAAVRLVRVAVVLLVLALLAAVPSVAGARTSPLRTTDVSSPGYKGIKRVPRTGPAPAPPAISLGAGKQPDVLVDAAGTSHIVWNEEAPAGGSDITHYCRIPRGAKACDNPSGTPFPPITAPYSADFDGPKIAQLGDGLVVLSHRYPAVVRQPDGEDRDRTTYMWSSVDGGQTFTGPAIVGTSEISGDIAVVGDRIAVISDTVTGGTRVQVLAGGVFDPVPILLGPGDAAYDGTVADDGGAPIAAFRDLNNVITIRRWTGAGDVHDPGTWTAATLPGVQPSLATGPSGAWLQYRKTLLGPWAVQPLAGAAPTGRAEQITPDDGNTDDGELLQDASGRLRAMFISGAVPERLLARTREPGGSFGGADLVAQADGLSRLRASMTADGGGVAVFERTQGGVADVAATAFGTLSPTGKPGAGSRAGGGIPGGEAGCTLVKFAAVQARPRGGCFLPSVDPAYRGAVVSEGEVDLNGLAIVPNAGVRIVIDPRRRTIDTTGDVRVVLRGGGLPELTIMRGELHLKLDGDKAFSGRTLLDLSANGLDLGGFPIGGRIAVKLAADGARIPLSLTLPKALGGISGQATLAVHFGTGVTVESARIRAATVPLGPLAIEDLDIGYAGGQWDGKALLRLPPPRTGAGLGVEVTFRNGRFVRGAVRLELPGLGAPIGPNVYFTGARGSFGVEPIAMSVGGSVGAIALTPVPPRFGVTANGDITLRIAREVELGLKVDVQVLGWQVSQATGLITTGGYARFDGNFGVNLAGVLGVNGTMGFAVDGPSKRFAGKFVGETSIAGVPVAGGAGVISNRGTAACGTLLGGHSGVWIPFDGSPEFFADFGGCEDGLKGYEGPPVARTAQAGATTFTVPAGQRAVSVEVTGAGAVPSVALVGPGGQRIVPGPPAAGATAFAIPAAVNNQLIVALKAPAAGTWRVEAQPGSAPVAGVRAALPAAPITVRGSLRGRGRSRTLRYTARGLQAGTRVQVFEEAGRASRPLGVITRASGTLRLKAGEGSPGLRSIVGYVERDDGGVPPAPITIARYRAPGAPAAPRVRGATASLRNGRATVTWRRAGAAAGYLVTVRLRDGRVLTRTPGRRARSVRIGGLGRAARLRSATVRSRTAAGLLGPAATARVRR